MQKIYGISVKNGQKLKILLRFEIEGKLTKKTFFWTKKCFFVFFLQILKFLKRFFFVICGFPSKQKLFFVIEIRYCLQEKILGSIAPLQTKLSQKVHPPPHSERLSGGRVKLNIGFSGVNSSSARS